MATRLFVTSNQPYFYRAIKASVLASSLALQIAGNASSVKAALQAIQRLKQTQACPDILIIYIVDAEQEIVWLIQNIYRNFKRIKIIVLTDLSHKAFLLRLLKLEIEGCFLHEILLVDLIRAVHMISQGYSQVDSNIIRQLFPYSAVEHSMQELCKEQHRSSKTINNSQQNIRLAQLSSREFEIIQRIAQGESNQEISQKLFIAEKTVKNHITKIFRKLGIKNRTQAAILAKGE